MSSDTEIGCGSELSQRAIEAMSRFEDKPLTLNEMEVMWQSSLLPIFEEFMAAMKSRTSALPSSYFRPHDRYSNPCVYIVDVKSMWMLFDGIDRNDAHLAGEISRAIFMPFMSKWSEALDRLSTVYGVRQEAAVVKKDLGKVISCVRARWSGTCDDTDGEPYFNRHHRFAESFFRSLRALEYAVERVVSGQSPSGGRTRFKHDSKSIEMLREGRRLRIMQHNGRKMKYKDIITRLANDPYYSPVVGNLDERRMGRLVRDLSEYCRLHPESV